MSGQFLRMLACTSLSLTVLPTLHGCLSRVHTQGPHGGPPARPALGAPIDRAGRPLTSNALIAPLGPDELTDRRREAYNRAAPADWAQFSGEIQQSVALYDGFDGTCGNAWLAERDARAAPLRYHALANLLADDRIWVNSRATACRRYLAVELAELADPGSSDSPNGDCGGRALDYDANDVFRSLLVFGTTNGVDDGVDADDHRPSAEFPFLVAP
jgi:hypothetical protein